MYLLVRDIIDALEAALVVVVRLELGAEHLGVNGFPLLGSPCGIVDAVGDIADMKLFREIALVHIRKYVLADLSVKHRHAVDVLRTVSGKDAHAEALVMVVHIHLTKP